MLTKNFTKKVLNVFMQDISALGGSIFYFFIVIFAFISNQILLTIHLVITYVLFMCLIILIRAIYFKNRPKKQKHTVNFLDKIDASSFPSAHATRITVLLISLLLFFSLNLKLLIFFSLLTLIILYSRFYLKKHYLIDLVGGVIFGFICSFIVTFHIGLI